MLPLAKDVGKPLEILKFTSREDITEWAMQIIFIQNLKIVLNVM